MRAEPSLLELCRMQPRMAERSEVFERIARYFGNADYSVSSFIEHIINEHLDANVVNYESWFSVISKSF